MKNSNAITLRLFQIITVVALVISGLIVENLTKANAETKFNESNSKEEMPKLQGSKAIEYLQKTGKYNSLLEAMNYGDKLQNSLFPTNSVYLRTQKLIASSGVGGDIFGTSVAISGNTVVVGAPGRNIGKGSVYVFTFGGGLWEVQTILDGENVRDNFGYSIDIKDDILVVGAPYADESISVVDSGAVYVFVRNGTSWTQQTKLQNSLDFMTDSKVNDHFGVSVDFDLDKVIIGADDDIDDDNSFSLRKGSASVFQRVGSNWNSFGNKILGDEFNREFGRIVSISGGKVIVGCNSCTVNGNGGQGKASIFEFSFSTSTWVSQGNLSSGDAADSFGKSVAIDGGWVVIGAPGTGQNENGAAFVSSYNGSTWSNPMLLRNGNGNERLGSSVAIDGDTLVIGSLSNFRGNTYIYKYNGSVWQEKATIFQKNVGSSAADQFGSSTDIDGNRIIVGAKGDNINGNGFSGSASVFQNLPPRLYDFDGNGASDISVFRTSTGVWYWYNLMTNQAAQVGWGVASDKITPADYDGDGKTDNAVFRPSTGTWYIYRSSDSQVTTAQFGLTGDLPIPNDFDGDGKSDIAVWRPSNQVWYWVNSSDSQFNAVTFGQSGDIPVIADFDGDSKGDLSVFRPSNGSWNWRTIANPEITSFTWGISGDIPTNGDFDADGKTDYAIFRSSTNTWWVTRSSNGTNFSVQYGANGDIPAPADYDCDGKTDVGVWRPSTGVWYILKSSNTECERSGNANIILQFGSSGDKPIPSAYLP